jgi:RNA polymerase sigma-70 factor (ECF subfamily)
MCSEAAHGVFDWHLVQASAAGDERAFEQLYHQYHRRVYSLCLRILGNPADAEDVTQDVFLQLFRKLGTFRGDSAFTTWLHRMTVNAALMYLRKSVVRHEQAEADEQIRGLTDRRAHEHSAIPLIDRLALERAIQQLPPGYRTVFVLHDVEGYEHDEIARMLGISVGTTKSQLHKARLKLRQMLSATVPQEASSVTTGEDTAETS